jgi:4-hydroxy 2-oxovalerate aldolase
MISFLDCTLRDGGYYNSWDFDPVRAEHLIAALNDAGVQIIEIGYKAPYDNEKYFGLFKNCNEDYLDFLSKDDKSDYAFMVDVKDFILDGQVDTEELDRHIRHCDESVFTWVRLASHFATLGQIEQLTTYFRQKAYKVGFNLMGGSLLSNEQIAEGARVAEAAKVDIFYIADSFGSFYPDDVRAIIQLIKSNFNGDIGIHTHDNQGMAYANTLVAIEEGVKFVDGTVTGMGRGAGNLLTEQFLLGYSIKHKDDRFSPSALLHIIESYIEPMKREHRWGYDKSYMYSGLVNIHPTYGQRLTAAGRYTSSEIMGILSAIPDQNRSKFNEEVLVTAVKRELNKGVSEELIGETPIFDTDRLAYDNLIILAKGPNAEMHIDSLIKLSEKMHTTIVECNPTALSKKNFPHVMVVLNQLKLQDWMENSSQENGVELVTGKPVDTNAEFNLKYHPFSIDNFNPKGSQLEIPDYDAGFYAIALAIKAGVKNIWLAGFDGFADADLNLAKEALFKQVKKYAEKEGIRIKHITPTRYSVFSQQSLYTL